VSKAQPLCLRWHPYALWYKRAIHRESDPMALPPKPILGLAVTALGSVRISLMMLPPVEAAAATRLQIR